MLSDLEGKEPRPLAGGDRDSVLSPPAQLQGRAALTAPTFGFQHGSRGADTNPTIPGGRSGNQLPVRKCGSDRLNPHAKPDQRNGVPCYLHSPDTVITPPRRPALQPLRGGAPFSPLLPFPLRPLPGVAPAAELRTLADTTSLNVVLRIEPGLHACQVSALPLEPHPQPNPRSLPERVASYGLKADMTPGVHGHQTLDLARLAIRASLLYLLSLSPFFGIGRQIL
ncbi:uncharacterized protein LOC124103716 [Marmota monax]|uniref:uncharacterized protein LOC124103716 n=1 Tax=Marmota monax TaxID=9995 RepID=UPI001EB09746|nr:uncharacterized protein LOC124103716 [Marmota monax]